MERLFACLLLLTAPLCADILPDGHAPVTHEILILGLDTAPEGTHFAVFPTSMSGGWTRIENGVPFHFYKFCDPHLYAFTGEAPPTFTEDDAPAGLPVSSVSFSRVSSVDERRATRAIRTIYRFGGLHETHIKLTLESETHYDAEGRPVSPTARRSIPRAWYALSGIGLALIVILVQRKRANE